MKLKNPLDSTKSISKQTKLTSAVSNDIAGVCPICMDRMEILNTGNDTKAYVCLEDRICLPVQDSFIEETSL